MQSAAGWRFGGVSVTGSGSVEPAVRETSIGNAYGPTAHIRADACKRTGHHAGLPALRLAHPAAGVCLQPCGPPDSGHSAGADQARAGAVGHPAGLSVRHRLCHLLCHAWDSDCDVGRPQQPAQHHRPGPSHLERDDRLVRDGDEFLAAGPGPDRGRGGRGRVEPAVALDDCRYVSTRRAGHGDGGVCPRGQPGAVDRFSGRRLGHPVVRLADGLLCGGRAGPGAGGHRLLKPARAAPGAMPRA